MSHWNYRVIYHPSSVIKVLFKEFPQEEYYGIHEVYYDDSGEPSAYATRAIIIGDTEAELKEVIEQLEVAFTKPVLEIDKSGKKVLKVKEK